MLQTSIIKRVIRPLRGGSQARLVQNEEGRHFVAKFLGNPQGSRTLINEFVATALMERIGIRTPHLGLLVLPDALRTDPTLCFHRLGQSTFPDSGYHLGSECPANPDKVAMFDFLPPKLFKMVANAKDFAAALIADRWLNQTDKRQAIFFREPKNSKALPFTAVFIDQGFAFAGPDWKLGEYPDVRYDATQHSILARLDLKAICQTTMARIDSFTYEELIRIADSLPKCWFKPGDRLALERLFASLLESRAELAARIEYDFVIRMSIPRFGHNPGSILPGHQNTEPALVSLSGD